MRRRGGVRGRGRVILVGVDGDLAVVVGGVVLVDLVREVGRGGRWRVGLIVIVGLLGRLVGDRRVRGRVSGRGVRPLLIRLRLRRLRLPSRMDRLLLGLRLVCRR